MGDWLPSHYNDVSNYFTDILMFLYKYEWIYNWSVTHILIENAVFKIPPEWVSAMGSLSDKELNELHRRQSEIDWPESLQSFLSDCQKFQLSVKSDKNREPNFTLKYRKGLSPKKEHEVARLAALINSECSKSNIKFVMDIGSGLGYLCEVLHLELGYSVIALESDAERTLKAIQRHNELQMKGNFGSFGILEYHTCHLSEDSAGDVESILSKMYDVRLVQCNGGRSMDVCMVGLHPCGDLTPSAMHLFDRLNELKLLILLPCCYHRRALKSFSEVEETFENFPLSDPLREAAKDFEKRTHSKGARFLRRPLLRLAAQRASSAWEEVEEKYPNERVVNTLATAAVYLLAHQALGTTVTEKATLSKKKRRPVRRRQMTSLDNLLSDAIDRYEFVSPTSEDDRTRLTKLRRLCDDHEPYLRHIAILLALQSALQPVVEGLVLADCIAKLNTQGYNGARLMRLTDPVLSPRGVALIASKDVVCGDKK